MGDGASRLYLKNILSNLSSGFADTKNAISSISTKIESVSTKVDTVNTKTESVFDKVNYIQSDIDKKYEIAKDLMVINSTGPSKDTGIIANITGSGELIACLVNGVPAAANTTTISIDDKKLVTKSHDEFSGFVSLRDILIAHPYDTNYDTHNDGYAGYMILPTKNIILAPDYSDLWFANPMLLTENCFGAEVYNGVYYQQEPLVFNKSLKVQVSMNGYTASRAYIIIYRLL